MLSKFTNKEINSCKLNYSFVIIELTFTNTKTFSVKNKILTENIE